MKLVDLFEKQTLAQLQQSVVTGFPGTTKRQNDVGSVKIDNITYTPFRHKSKQILRVNADTASNNGHAHKVIVELRGVEFGAVDGGVEVTSTDGQQISITPVSLNTSYVGVSCDCPDYIFRFANYNINNDCHVGPIPPRYIRKTTNRPEVNPNKVPGMCKHVMAAIGDLRKIGLVR
jgi:hypothetical protein